MYLKRNAVRIWIDECLDRIMDYGFDLFYIIQIDKRSASTYRAAYDHHIDLRRVKSLSHDPSHEGEQASQIARSAFWLVAVHQTKPPVDRD